MRSHGRATQTRSFDYSRDRAREPSSGPRAPIAAGRPNCPRCVAGLVVVRIPTVCRATPMVIAVALTLFCIHQPTRRQTCLMFPAVFLSLGPSSLQQLRSWRNSMRARLVVSRFLTTYS